MQDAALLVYFIVDPYQGGHRMITLFPVSQKSVAAGIQDENFGSRKPITTRYNGCDLARGA